jgi:hypothetical protein
MLPAPTTSLVYIAPSGRIVNLLAAGLNLLQQLSDAGIRLAAPHSGNIPP